MGLSPHSVLEHVIRPVLADLPAAWRGRSAERLLLGTAAHESDGFQALHQYRGPACGLYQMEPPTFRAVQDWLDKRPDIARRVYKWAANPVTPAQLDWNLALASAFARAYYFMAPAPLPDAEALPALADYWHRYWCRGCAGTPQRWLNAWQQHVARRFVEV